MTNDIRILKFKHCGTSGSFMIVLPKHLVEELNWQSGDGLEITREGAHLDIKKFFPNTVRNFRF